MTKYYHMIIQRISNMSGETRKEYISRRQGYAPPGWKCVGVCGWHEKSNLKENYYGRKIWSNYCRIGK